MISLGGSKDLDWLRGEAERSTPGQPPFDASGEIADSGATPAEVSVPDWLKPIGAGEGGELGEAAFSPFAESEKPAPDSETPAAAPGLQLASGRGRPGFGATRRNPLNLRRKKRCQGRLRSGLSLV
jgi:hypothetical protein